MGAAIQIQCERCGQVLTGLLREVVDYDALEFEYGEPVVPVGSYGVSEAIIACEEPCECQPNELIVHRESLVDVVEGGPRVGCCGPSDGEWNLFCQKGHPVGIEMADCYLPHFVRVPLNRVKVIKVDVG